jgi:hypothetical protein
MRLRHFLTQPFERCRVSAKSWLVQSAWVRMIIRKAVLSACQVASISCLLGAKISTGGVYTFQEGVATM